MIGNIKHAAALSLVVGSLMASVATATPLFFERIFPDTKITRVKSEYDATTNIFTQRTRYAPDENPATSALYRQTISSNGDNVSPLEWNLRMEVDEQGNLIGSGMFELFGAVDFEDPSKMDLSNQLLLRGSVLSFGVGVYENVFPNGAITPISYNILGLTSYSAPGIDYGGYVGMIWTDDPTPLAGGGARSNAAELWGSDWESDDRNITRAQADIFVVPAPSSIVLLALPLIALLRGRKAKEGSANS